LSPYRDILTFLIEQSVLVSMMGGIVLGLVSETLEGGKHPNEQKPKGGGFLFFSFGEDKKDW